jgi:cytoskeleton protein RodZ
VLIVAAIALMYFRGHESAVEPSPTEVSLGIESPDTESPRTEPVGGSADSGGALPVVPPEATSTPPGTGQSAVPAPASVTTGAAGTSVATAVAPGASTDIAQTTTSSTRGDPTAAGESFASASVGGGSGGGEVRLNFARDAWVEVKDATGSIVFSQLNTAGSERIVRGQPPFQLVVGNASGVTVTYNAREVDLAPHTRTDVARITLE